MSIKIDLKLFLFAIIFSITHQINMYAAFMVFAFLHELGHLFCGLLLGFKPKSITMTPFGFQMEFFCKVEKHHQNRKKILIALAGPFTNVMIAFICFFLPFQNHATAETVIYANSLLAIFNLIPIYPLDGGRILKECVYSKFGLKKAYKVTNKTANVMVFLLTLMASISILYIHNISIVLILIYLWYLVIQNHKISLHFL